MLKRYIKDTMAGVGVGVGTRPNSIIRARVPLCRVPFWDVSCERYIPKC